MPATAFELNYSEAWVLAKDSFDLSVTSYTPTNASATITWSSSNTDLATVNSNGHVTTVVPGDVTITATSEKGVQASCLLHLCYPVTAVELTAPAERMFVGLPDMQLTASVTMRTQTCVNYLVTFSSSDEAIATVDSETGLVHGVSEGEVTITATSRSGKTSSVTFNVYEISPDSSLKILFLPASLLRIEDEAFMESTAQAVVIPSTCTSIGHLAFAHCPNLLYVEIPAACTSIADDAFFNSPNVFIHYTD